MSGRNSDNPTPAAYQISVRFGDEIMQSGFTAVPNLVLDQYATLGITPGEMMFIIHVWQYWWTERDPYPSLKTIAAKMSVSRRQVSNYTQSLKSKGLLLVHERQDPGLGQVTSEYDFEPLIQAITGRNEGVKNISSPPMNNPSRGGMKHISRAPMKDISTEEDPDQEDPDQEDPDQEDPEKKTQDNKSFEPSNLRVVKTDQQQGREQRQGPAQPSRTTESVESVESVGAVLQRRRGRPPKAAYADPDRQVILDYVTDFAREFSDQASLASSTTRAYNIYKTAGVDLDGFIAAMHQARSIVKERSSSIRTRADNPIGSFAVKNKMPFWYSVLEDVLGLREHPNQPQVDS